MIKKELDKKSAELKLIVSLDTKEWKEAQKKAKETLIKDLSIPGFRKGKVPANKAEAYISEGKVLQEAVNKVLPKMEKEARAEIKDEDKVLDSPIYQISKIDLENLEIELLYPVYPEIKLPDYKKLGVKLEKAEATKEDIEKSIERVVESHALVVESKDPVKEGDTVVFDFKGFIDGVAFEGGEAEDFDLKIGSKNFIPGFEDALIGFKKGEKKDIFVSFPADYHVKDYAGKEAKFEINMKEIKTLEKPELTDEFVKELGIPNVSNIKELEASFKDITTREKQEAARVKFQKEAFEKILSNVEIPISERLVLNEMERLNKQFENNLKQQGFSKKEYIELTKMSEDDVKAEFRKEAIKNLQNAFVYAEIARLENIVAKEEDYEEEYAKLSKLYGQSADAIKQVISVAQLQIPITNRKVVDKLIELNS